MIKIPIALFTKQGLEKERNIQSPIKKKTYNVNNPNRALNPIPSLYSGSILMFFEIL
jgi:hypothetical protein